MDWSHLACLACGAIGVWLALTSGARRREDDNEPIRLADGGCWYPKAKGPPPAPRSRQPETRLTQRAATKPHVDEIAGWVDRFYGFSFDGWTHKDFTFRDDWSADFVVRFGNSSPRRFVLVSKDAFATLDKISVYEKDDPQEVK